jgi:hypothetical protein
MTDKRRVDISTLVKEAEKEAVKRGKKIKTIDPVFHCARRMFPFLSEPMILEYSRTALRIIRNRAQGYGNLPLPQTTLLTHFIHQSEIS